MFQIVVGNGERNPTGSTCSRKEAMTRNCKLCGTPKEEHYDGSQCPMGQDTWSSTQLFTPAPSPAPKCGKPAESMIPRWGMSWACMLEPGHEGDCRGGGNCFKHGEYVGPQCPQWPDCAKPPFTAQQIESMKAVPSPAEDEIDALINEVSPPPLVVEINAALTRAEEYHKGAK